MKRREYNLAEMYREGKGVTRDYEAAYGWYARSAAHAQGNVVATLALDELEKANPRTNCAGAKDVVGAG
jgi:TPR repeat protein